MNTSIAIVLVNYNGSNDTITCIESIEKFVADKYHIVLVDNDSKDFDYLESFSKRRNDITLIRNKENVGFAKANNIGIDYINHNMSYDYLFLLNNDTILTKDAVKKLVRPFADNPNIGITTSRIMYEHEKEIVWYGGGQMNYLRGKPKFADYNRPPSKTGSLESKYVTFISGCAMMFSKKSIKDLRGFDDDYFMYGEDVELSIRAMKLGYRLYYVSDSVIYHKVGGSLLYKFQSKGGLSAENPNLVFKFYHMRVNQWITMKKHLTGIKFIIFNIIFRVELYYKALRLYFSGRTDIFAIVKRCKKSIRQYG